MYKKATFVLMSIGALLLVGNSASAKITKYESYVTIKDATKEDYTIKYSASTLNDNKKAEVHTDASLFRGDEYLTDVQGNVKVSDTYTYYPHGQRITYKVKTDHVESVGTKTSDFKQSQDKVTYDPKDWTYNKVSDEEAKQEAQAFDNLLTQRANEIAADTGIDLSEYSLIEKTDVWEMDKDLFKEVRELTGNLSKGDKMPQIHLHESGESLYVLRQYADGTNTAVEFMLENGKWEKK
ncbi:hypothetical protein ABH14_00410 [Brevibacillus brevis]|uniref:hypothetical protein n=1 Tax=Brevibacillus brevis TaxID=1393 RepID=UPI0019020567|nr:hypothetical protein [Brevibacillus brevis]MBH0328273.1 hypothetical protein [Brevibacillus brevis]